MTVGPQIRRLRKAKGWTVAQLAVYADMSPSAVSQIETGRRSPTATSMEKLAEALEVEVQDLFPKAQPPLLEPDQERRGPSIVEGEAHLSGTGKLEATWKIMQVLEELADGKISLEVAKERAREAVAA